MSLWGIFANSTQAMTAQSIGLNAISQNIANINTTGYKKLDAEFKTLLGKAEGPRKFYTAREVTRQLVDKAGMIQESGRSYDLAVNGKGLFVLNTKADATGEALYTRNGSFSEYTYNPTADTTETILVGADNTPLMGWKAQADGTFLASGAPLQRVVARVDDDVAIGTATTETTIIGNVDAGSAATPGSADDVASGAATAATKAATAVTSITAANTAAAALTTTTSATATAATAAKAAIATAKAAAIAAQTAADTANTAAAAAAASPGVSLNAAASAAANASAAKAKAASIASSAATTAVYDNLAAATAAKAAVDANSNATATEIAAATAAYTSADALNTAMVAADTDIDLAKDAADTTASIASAAADTQTMTIPVVDNTYKTQGLILNWKPLSVVKNSSDIATSTWRLDFQVQESNGTYNGTVTPPAAGSNVVTFGSDGKVVSPDTMSVAISWATGGSSAITVDISKITQFASATQVHTATQDGLESGNFRGSTFDEDGVLSYSYTNGLEIPKYKVPVATFAAVNSLEAIGGTRFAETELSGEANITAIGEDGTSSFFVGGFESSNVDIGQEFTKMMLTQKAYSTAAQVFKTADEMTQQAGGLIR
ncbi:MAG: flagellar hook-basal body complex protein [Alphaproteobacteria bacterium]